MTIMSIAACILHWRCANTAHTHAQNSYFNLVVWVWCGWTDNMTHAFCCAQRFNYHFKHTTDAFCKCKSNCSENEMYAYLHTRYTSYTIPIWCLFCPFQKATHHTAQSNHFVLYLNAMFCFSHRPILTDAHHTQTYTRLHVRREKTITSIVHRTSCISVSCLRACDPFSIETEWRLDNCANAIEMRNWERFDAWHQI